MPRSRWVLYYYFERNSDWLYRPFWMFYCHACLWAFIHWQWSIVNVQLELNSQSLHHNWCCKMNYDLYYHNVKSMSSFRFSHAWLSSSRRLFPFYLATLLKVRKQCTLVVRKGCREIPYAPFSSYPCCEAQLLLWFRHKRFHLKSRLVLIMHSLGIYGELRISFRLLRCFMKIA